jgi:hypothetical protein
MLKVLIEANKPVEDVFLHSLADIESEGKEKLYFFTKSK